MEPPKSYAAVARQYTKDLLASPRILGAVVGPCKFRLLEFAVFLAVLLKSN